MANVDRPNGATPVRHVMGADVTANAYNVDASNGTAIFPGDFMIREADGNVAPYTGTGGGNLIGVCAGIDGDFADLSRSYLPVSTAGVVWIYDDPYLTFRCQTDDVDGSALTAAAEGANCDVEATAGSTTSQRSRHEIDRSTVNTTTAQLRLLRLYPIEGNAYGASDEWEVSINEHTLKSTTGT